MRLIPQLIMAGLSCLPVLAQAVPYDYEWIKGLNLGLAPGLDNTYHPKQKIYTLGTGHNPSSLINSGNVRIKVNSSDARWLYKEVYTLDGSIYVGYYKYPILIKDSAHPFGYFGPEAPGFDADNDTIIIGTPAGWGILRRGWGGVAQLTQDSAPYFGPGYVGHTFSHSLLFPASYGELCYDGYDYVMWGNFGNGARIAYARPRWGGWFFIGPNGKNYYPGDTSDMCADNRNQCWTLDYNNDGFTDIAYTRPGWGGYMLMLSQYGGSYTKRYVPYNNQTTPEPPPTDPTGPTNPTDPTDPEIPAPSPY